MDKHENNQTTSGLAVDSASAGSHRIDGMDIQNIKERLNGIVWEYAPPTITLHEAENISCHLLSTLLSLCDENNVFYP